MYNVQVFGSGRILGEDIDLGVLSICIMFNAKRQHMVRAVSWIETHSPGPFLESSNL